jgi:hypothetical protein
MRLRNMLKRAIGLAMLALAWPVCAHEASPEEVRASYILKMRPFLLFGEENRHFQTICYYEKPYTPPAESVGQIIASVTTQHADTYPDITTRAFGAVGDFSGCDVLYIPAEQDSNLDTILAALDGASTLTFSNVPRFIFRGGMIGFMLDDANRVKMAANVKNMRAKGVHVDSQILELMPQVTGQ